MKITIIPNVSFRGQVRNYGSNGKPVGDTDFMVLNFMNDAITLDIPNNLDFAGIKREIKRQLKNLIKEIIEDNIHNDIKGIIGEEGSPPQLIELPDAYYLDAGIRNQFYKDNINATFNVLTTSNKKWNNTYFGQEKVWDNRQTINPVGLNQNTWYKGTDEKLTCAYDFIINEYANTRNNKFTTGYNVSGKRGEKVRGKDLIDYWVSLPFDKHKQIYESWCKKYEDSIFIGDIATRKIHPIHEEIGIQDLEDDLWDIKFMNIDTDYTKEDTKETLSIVDLVKWCITADVRLVVKDYNNRHYLEYNPAHFQHEYKTTNRNTAIVLKVEHRHAYFETDTNKKKSALKKDELRQTLDYEELRSSHKKKEKKEVIDLPVEYHFDKTLKIETIPPCYWGGANQGDGGIVADLRDQQIYSHQFGEGVHVLKRTTLPSGKVKQQRVMEQVKNFDDTELIGWMNDKEHQHVLYRDASSLNKLAVRMLVEHQLKHDYSYGGVMSIRQLTYGNLLILSRCGKKETKDLVDDFDDRWDEVYKKYPDLKKKTGAIPTAKQVGDCLWKRTNPEPILSTMSGQLRSIFYNAEIKPENIDLQPIYTENPVVSFDIKKAYTTALECNEFMWNVYDCVSQPTKFNGKINIDWFYLAEGISTDYPVKQGVGLMLYHGCLARHLHPKKITIKYQIEPKRQLEPELFKEFVEMVKKEELLDRLVGCKSIINNFIGGLKRKDHNDNYKHHITDDKNTINRALEKGNQPTKLDWVDEEVGAVMVVRDERVGSRWVDGVHPHKDYWLISNQHKNTHYQNGQPIRLQVIDMINEQMYKFSRWARKYYRNPTLSIRTDAVYLQTKYEEIDCVSAEEIQDRLDLWNDDNSYKFEVEKTLSNEEYENMRFKQGDIGLTKGFKFIPNKWDNEIVIDKAWSKDRGANLLLNAIIGYGGCYIEGMAGRGKSELLLALHKKCRKNKVRYVLYKECLRLIGATNRYDRLKEWRSSRPVSVKMFAPTNKAANRVNGKTLHKGWGIPVVDTDEVDDDDGLADEEEQEKTEEQIQDCFTDKIIESFSGDGHKKDCLDFAVIDEAGMCNGEMISYIAYFKQKLPDTKIILCGDLPHQLPPVKEENRNFQDAYAIKEITNYTRLQLNYNFRMDTESDELWDKWSIKPQKFHPVCDRKTTRNLCRFNRTRKKVIEELQDLIPNPVVIETTGFSDPRGHTRFTKYGLGTPMIARVSNLAMGLAKNDMYYILSLGSETEPLKLSNLDDDEPQTLDIEKDELLKYFQSGYCITIHKSQGETYKDEYTIHDWRRLASDKSLLGRKLRYVAQSRSSNPSANILYRL